VKIVVAMSGGVDSSVAAALLKKAGHDVTGVTMRLFSGTDAETDDVRTLKAISDSKAVADRLDIPHIVMDFSEAFSRHVIENFCREYSRGRTPNPCILCNKFIKFGALMDKALEMGADYLATGHHARLETDESTGTILLKKGVDTGKDQSYFLCRLDREQLRHVMFPVGNLTKDRVRQIAREMHLPIAARSESQEICFIPDDDYARFLKDHISEEFRPGPILDEAGNTLGTHRGLPLYTIGQRKGLGVAAAEPLYVTAIRPEENAVIAGTKAQTYRRELVAADMNWIGRDIPERPFKAQARIRYRHPEADAEITPRDNNSVYVKFAEPQMAITPGQAVVFYDGDTVIGSGTIIE
jgi:tRNA-specific 2-thiouridylase